jgi:DNA-binding CsgD family transcriptional regulator
MLGEEAIFRTAGGRLMAREPNAERSLRAAFAAAAAGDDGLGSQGIAVPLTAAGQLHLAHVLPLTSGSRRKAGASYAAAAAVFVRKAELDAPPAPEVIAKLYGLTPSELRVLLSVFDSGGVTNVAEALGISEATAKTHLRRLFEKTGTRRQADLVKLVAGFTALDR